MYFNISVDFNLLKLMLSFQLSLFPSSLRYHSFVRLRTQNLGRFREERWVGKKDGKEKE